MSVQLKEGGVKTTDLQQQLDKASKQQQELQTQQQNSTSKLREAQVSSSQVPVCSPVCSVVLTQ